MGAVGKFFGIILILFFAAVMFRDFSGDNPNDLAAKDLAQNALGKLQQGADWDHIDIVTAKQNDYLLILRYRSEPANIYVSVQDMRNIAHAVLSALVAAGKNPASNETSLWVYAEWPDENGETGAKLWKTYGHVEYNADDDRIDFKPQKAE